MQTPPLAIREGCFSPKAAGFETGSTTLWRAMQMNRKTITGIFFPGCNFDCSFCYEKQGKKREEQLQQRTYDVDELRGKIRKLISQRRNAFKVTGGEPMLHPFAADLVRMIREEGGVTYLDTNGSYPERVAALVREKLVDILGVSLKGLTKEKAMQVAKNSGTLSWENPQRTVRESLPLDPHLIAPVTWVVPEDFRGIDDLHDFARILGTYERNGPQQVKMKINTYPREENPDLEHCEVESLIRTAQQFVKERPEWDGHVSVFRYPDVLVNL